MATLDDLLTVTADEEATPEEEVAALQRLISSGSWGFEGSVGRAMMAAIEFGDCVLGPKPAYDFFGNRIPSRDEVEPGTLGSIAYANALRLGRGDEPITDEYLTRIEEGV